MPVTIYGPARMCRNMHGISLRVLTRYSRKSMAAYNRFLICPPRAHVTKQLIFLFFAKTAVIIKSDDLFTEPPASPGMRQR